MTLIEKCDGLCVNCKRMVCVRECTAFPEKEEQLIQLQVLEPQEGYGVAFDLGTTTIVGSLVDLKHGKEVCRVTRLNPQRRHGQDVLSRITYVQRNPEEGKKRLQEELIGVMNDILAEFRKDDIRKIVVASNCIMAHFLLGEDPCGMGISPYRPVFTETKHLTARVLGLKGKSEMQVVVLPHSSAYVGGDVVGGISIISTPHTCLYLDIGTNGEMILKNGDTYYSCSCAVGPALEGMGLSCGMPAGSGAIDEVMLQNGRVEAHVLGDTPVKGLCGSGVLTAIHALVKGGWLAKDGAFIEDCMFYEIHKNVTISQQDIRQVQLAKGAILAGVQSMLSHADVTMEQVEQVYIAGTFGKHIPQHIFTELGILPKEAEGKICYVGNGALRAAQQVLCDESILRTIENLGKKMEYLDLAIREDYMQKFMDSLSFTFCV